MIRPGWTCFRCLARSAPLRSRQFIKFQSNVSQDTAAVPDALVERARGLAVEHETLTKRLADQFDTRTAKRLGEILPVASALKAWDEAHSSISELHALLDDPTTDAELRSLANTEINQTKQILPTLGQNLSASLIPPDPLDSKPCMIEIRPGAGGDEAALFAGDVLRMYNNYLTRRGLQYSLMSLDTPEGEAGENRALANIAVEEAIIEIESPGAFGLLRYESGVHRVQRVPATETKGRTHTSSASVMVLPSMPENGESADENDPNSDFYVNVSEVRTDVMRSKGAGGQHVNKTESAVRLTHLPTGIVVRMEDGRSQHKNREKAWKVLRSRLADRRRAEREARVLELRRGTLAAGKMGREDKIRTYNYGQQRVTDHRSGYTINRLDDVIAGGEALDGVIESTKAHMLSQQVEALMHEL